VGGGGVYAAAFRSNRESTSQRFTEGRIATHYRRVKQVFQASEPIQAAGSARHCQFPETRTIWGVTSLANWTPPEDSRRLVHMLPEKPTLKLSHRLRPHAKWNRLLMKSLEDSGMFQVTLRMRTVPRMLPAFPTQL